LSWLSITPEGGRSAYVPGERLRGGVAWLCDEAPARVALHLLWYTEGKGTQEITVVATRELGTLPQGSADFDLELPHGPWSCAGKLVSLLWALELVVEPGELVERLPIVLAPAGREVRLHTGAGEGAAEGMAATGQGPAP
jgi:hypothetical protein